MAGEVLTGEESARLNAWRSQGNGEERLWPDDHAVVKRPWVEVQ